MTTPVSWTLNANGDWETPGNWSSSPNLPDSNDDVIINTSAIYTVTHNGGNDIVNSLTVGNDYFQMNGGSLDLLTGGSFSLNYAQNGGTLTGAGTVSVTGAGNLLGGGASGSLAFKIGGAIQLSNYTLAGSTTLTNNGTTNQTGGITIGDASGVNAKITNSASGTYTINGDYGITQGAATASFVNAGLLQKTAATGASTIAVSLTDTGTITVLSGTLQSNGPTDSYAGAINGAGTFSMGGGSAQLIKSGTTITSGGWTVTDNGTAVTLGENVTYAGAFVQNSGSTINLAGYKLTLNGPTSLYGANFGTPTVNGTGYFVTYGAVSVNSFILGGTLIWNDYAAITQTAALQIGDGSTNAATFNVTSYGQYYIANDTNIEHGVASNSTLNVAGTLAKTAGTGSSFIDVDTTSTGKITANSGFMGFRGPNNSFSGTITGAGQVGLEGGSVDTIASGTTITSAGFGVYDNGTNVTLGGNLSYAGTFNQGYGTTINLNGHTLTLSGPASFYNANFGTPTVNGSGVLATSGATSVNLFVLGGTVTWNDTGAITQTGALTIGDGGTGAAILNVQSAGQYNISTDTNIEHGAALNSTLNVIGTLAKTGGTGTSFIDADTTNTGKITIGSGTMEFRGPNNSFAGTISGAGQFAIGGGSVDKIANGAAITSSSFGIYDNGTSVTLGGSLTYAGAFTQAYGTVINLNGYKLALTGSASFFNANFGTPTVNGSGYLATFGAVSVNLFTLGGTVIWNDWGSVTQTGALQIGDGSTNAATLNVGGTYNLANDTNIERGTASNSTLTVAGQLAKTGGTGTSYIDINTTSTGKISVGTGTMEFRGPTNSLGGTVTGVGQFVLGSGSATTITNATINVSALSIVDNGTSVTLGSNLTYGGAFTQGFGTSINLSGNTLTLSGTNSLYNANFQTPTINGTGTLATSGVTSVNGFILGGSVTWNNSGTVNQTANLQVGDSGSVGATFSNLGTGVYNLQNDTGVSLGTAATSQFINAGTFSKAAGTGTSLVGVAFQNNGTVSVLSGSLQLGAGETGTGTDIISGASTLEYGLGASAGQTVSFTGAGGVLDLLTPQAFQGSVSGFDTVGSNDTLAFYNAPFSTAWSIAGFSENGGGTQGTLTMSNGTSTASVLLNGNYTAGLFHTGSGSAGTLVTYG